MQEANQTSVKSNPAALSNQRMIQEDQIDLFEIAETLFIHWWKIAITTLLGALMMLGYFHFIYVPCYTATAKLYVNNSSVNLGFSQVSINSSDLNASHQLVNIYSEFINTHLILDATGDALSDQGFDGYDYYSLTGHISAKAAGDTQMLYLTATDHDPEAAIAIINALIQTLPDLSSNIIEGSSIVAIDPAYSASLQGTSLKRLVMMGAMGGFVLSAGLVLLYYFFLNDQVKRQEWIQETYPTLPQLGCVPDTLHSHSNGYPYYDYGYGYGETEKDKKKPSRKQSGSAKIGADLSFMGTEAYNTIRTNLKFSFHSNERGHVIGITSAMPGDGKTYTALNLAYAMAKDNLRVLLIDGDMRKLTLNQYFEEKPECGLSELLTDQANLADALSGKQLHENLTLLFSGKMPPNPSELLGSKSMEQLLDTSRDHFDYIIIDLPPVGSVIDAAAVSAYLDGIVVVVRNEHTQKKHIRSTLSQLEQADVRLLGFVYNANVERRGLYGRYYSRYYSRYYKRGYGYGYGYGYGHKSQKETEKK